MKIAVLSRNGNLYSTRRLVEASKERGHEVEVVDYLKCYFVIEKGHPEIHYHGKKLSDINHLIEEIGGAPLVVKLLQGTQGIGVVLAETKKAAQSVLEAFYGLEANMLIQEFIGEAKGADIRALVVGDNVVGAMKRQGAKGEFRSNIHRGGSANAIKLSKEEDATAIKAAQVLGLNIAGVDMIQSKRGPLIMEVNSSPGLEGIEKATNIDIAGKIIEFIEINVGNREMIKDRINV